MQFASWISATALFAVALASPVLVTERQTTPASAISASLNILQANVDSNCKDIVGATTNAQNNVDAAVYLAATVKANLDAIAKGFTDAAASIAASLQSSAGGVEAQIQALTQAEIDGLIANLQTLKAILSGLRATIIFEATNLLPAARATVETEIGVVLAVVSPVVNPIMIFADAVSKAQARLTVIVTGIQGAYNGVNVIAQQLAATNGLPGASFPGYPA